MAWVYLVIAGLLEVGWAIGLKYTDGFRRPVPSVLTVLAIVASMLLLATAARELPIGTAYAVWVGIGAFGDPTYVMRGLDSLNQMPKALESHLGLFKYGGIDIEGLINFDQVPNGALFIGLPVKHVGSPTAEMRAVAITDPELSRELLAAVKAHNVVDLTVPFAMDNPVAWPISNAIWRCSSPGLATASGSA